MTPLLTSLRDHLVGNGIARLPDTVGVLPPVWREPKLGTPAPGEGNNPVERGDLVIGLFLTGGIAPAPFGSWHRQPIVDVRLRGSRAQDIEQKELEITGALIDRRDWTMGTIGAQTYVIECQQWRALQRLGSDEQGYEYVVSYVFELLR